MCLGPFSAYWVAMSSHEMRVCAQSYCISLGHVLWISLEACFFSGGGEQRQEELICGKEESGEELKGEEGGEMAARM